MPESLFTWETLGTLSSQTFLTFIIVTYTKDLIDKLPVHIHTDHYAVVVGFLITFATSWYTQEHVSFSMLVLCVFNGFLNAMLAGKLADKNNKDKDTKIFGEV